MHTIGAAKETINATNVKMGAAEALALARTVEKIIAAKGKSLVTIDMKSDGPGDDELLAVLLGPTGNLRAPTMKVGKTLLVGFNEESYAKTFGIS
jgi:arsenate reductase-like glutaredoxin family protein